MEEGAKIKDEEKKNHKNSRKVMIHNRSKNSSNITRIGKHNKND